MTKRLKYIILFSILVFSQVSTGNESIIIFKGVFDPWSKADQAKIESLKKLYPNSKIIISPIDDTFSDFPLPVKTRIKLIKLVNQNSSRIYYAKNVIEESNLVNRLKENQMETAVYFSHNKNEIPIQPERVILFNSEPVDNFHLQSNLFQQEVIKIEHEEVKKPQDIRQYLLNTANVFFDEKQGFPPPEGIDQKIFENIVTNGYYLNHKPSPSPSLDRIKAFLANLGRNLGLFDPIRSIIVKIKQNPNLQYFELEDGTKLKIKKYLGSGIAGDAYIMDNQGQKVVLKVSKDGVDSKERMIEANLTHKWLSKNSTLDLPNILDQDKNGQWQLLELVEGDSIESLMKKFNGDLPKDILTELEKFHKKTSKLAKRQGIKLDISADNIFIRNGKPVLVDFGPLNLQADFTYSWKETLERWRKSSGVKKVKFKNTKFCFKNALQSLLSLK